MDFLYVFEKMIELFLILIVGYIACRCKIFEKDGRTCVSRLILNVTVPALILSSAMNGDSTIAASQILWILFVATACFIIIFAIAFLVPKILKAPTSQIGVYRYILSFGNIGFIGYPVMQAIFGNNGVFYTSLFCVPFNILVYSVGVMFLDSKGSSGKISYKIFLTPCMISSAISIVIVLGHFQCPAIICDTCEMIADITTPAALMIIGSSLADMPIAEMFSNGKVYILAFFKLLFLPFAVYFAFHFFIKNELLLGVLVVSSAMPVATNGTMLCLQYGADEKLMAQGTFITTLLSVVTIPLVSMLLL